MKNIDIITVKYNVHSQLEDNGIIIKILKKYHERDKWCIEFSAWNGLNIKQSKSQVLSKYLFKFPSNHNIFQSSYNC